MSIGRHPGRRAGLTLSPYAGDRKGLFASRVRVGLKRRRGSCALEVARAVTVTGLPGSAGMMRDVQGRWRR